MEPMMTRKEVADMLGIGIQTVLRMNQNGSLPFVRVGNGRGRIRIKQKDVKKYIEQHTVDGV